MVPWLLARPGVPVGDAARQFGVSPAQIESDLALLFLCGTPGGMPDDLIEADWEDGRIYLGNADVIARPLRLTVDEALTLMVGLRALSQVPSPASGDAVLTALAKLQDAAGAVAGAAARITASLDEDAQHTTLQQLQDALNGRRRVHLRYLVPARDEVSERDVDPMRILGLDGRWYLEAWCHRAGAVRLFRLDRILGLDILDADGTPPEEAEPRDVDGSLFRPSGDDVTVVLEVDRSAAWIVDYYPVSAAVDLGDGSLRLTVQVGDTGWVRRLAWRMGGHVLVREPAELARAVTAGAAEALRPYPDAR